MFSVPVGAIQRTGRREKERERERGREGQSVAERGRETDSAFFAMMVQTLSLHPTP